MENAISRRAKGGARSSRTRHTLANSRWVGASFRYLALHHLIRPKAYDYPRFIEPGSGIQRALRGNCTHRSETQARIARIWCRDAEDFGKVIRGSAVLLTACADFKQKRKPSRSHPAEQYRNDMLLCRSAFSRSGSLACRPERAREWGRRCSASRLQNKSAS